MILSTWRHRISMPLSNQGFLISSVGLENLASSESDICSFTGESCVQNGSFDEKISPHDAGSACALQRSPYSLLPLHFSHFSGFLLQCNERSALFSGSHTVAVVKAASMKPSSLRLSNFPFCCPSSLLFFPAWYLARLHWSSAPFLRSQVFHMTARFTIPVRQSGLI